MELFVGTLGASSYTYVEATLNQSLESWAKAHKGMSDYFGGRCPPGSSSDCGVCSPIAAGSSW